MSARRLLNRVESFVREAGGDDAVRELLEDPEVRKARERAERAAGFAQLEEGVTGG